MNSYLECLSSLAVICSDMTTPSRDKHHTAGIDQASRHDDARHQRPFGKSYGRRDGYGVASGGSGDYWKRCSATKTKEMKMYRGRGRGFRGSSNFLAGSTYGRGSYSARRRGDGNWESKEWSSFQKKPYGQNKVENEYEEFKSPVIPEGDYEDGYSDQNLEENGSSDHQNPSKTLIVSSRAKEIQTPVLEYKSSNSTVDKQIMVEDEQDELNNKLDKLIDKLKKQLIIMQNNMHSSFE